MLPDDCWDCHHPREHHEHYSYETHCGTCRCRRYRRRAPWYRRRRSRHGRPGFPPGVTPWLDCWECGHPPSAHDGGQSHCGACQCPRFVREPWLARLAWWAARGFPW